MTEYHGVKKNHRIIESFRLEPSHLHHAHYTMPLHAMSTLFLKKRILFVSFHDRGSVLLFYDGRILGNILANYTVTLHAKR